ncbi:MAG: MFS transporter, partial [Pseudomonadota bacterium]
GGRTALTLGVLCIALSAFCRGLADDYWQLLGAVMLFGIGGPIVSSGAPKVVTEIFTGSRRGLAMGIYMTGPTLGGILALTLTHSVLLPAFDNDWRALMMLWGLVALLAAGSWLLIASTAGRTLLGGGADTAASMQSTPDGETGSKVERSTEESGGAISQILRVPGVPLVLAMSVGVFLINHGMNNWLPEMLRHGGMTVVEAGYWAALPMVVGIIGSLTIPRLAVPGRRMFILGGLCVAAVVSSLLLTVTDPATTTVALLVQGLVRSSLMTVLILTLVELPGIRPEQAGTASGLFFSAAEVGGVLGPLGLGVIYDLTQGFSAGLYALAAVAALMTLGTGRLAAITRPEPATARG